MVTNSAVGIPMLRLLIPCLSARLSLCPNSILNMTTVGDAFNQEKALVVLILDILVRTNPLQMQ